MGMQTDVLQSRLTNSGWIVQGPCRVKAVSLRNAASGVGRVFLFDTDTTPVTATYERAGTLVTVTKVAHGLLTGDTVSFGFSLDGSNRAATCGTYAITKIDADSFSLTDPNTGTVSASTACYYVTGDSRWIWVRGIADGDIYNNYELIPMDGIRAKKKVYAVIANIISTSVFYG